MGGKDSSLNRTDNAAAEAFVAVVNHGALARGDGALGHVVADMEAAALSDHRDALVPLAVAEAAGSGRRVFLGNAEAGVLRRLGANGALVYDYYTNDALTLYNARLTAEALLGLAVESLPVALLGAEIAVTGYGRIGFYTAWLFSVCGAKVTVFARSPLQLAKAAAAGLQALPLSQFADENRAFDCLINTVPAQILKRRELAALQGGCLLLEAASAPFGIDTEAAKEMGFRLVKASSLPGKVSPKSAGEAIAKTIDQRVRR